MFKVLILVVLVLLVVFINVNEIIVEFFKKELEFVYFQYINGLYDSVFYVLNLFVRIFEFDIVKIL